MQVEHQAQGNWQVTQFLSPLLLLRLRRIDTHVLPADNRMIGLLSTLTRHFSFKELLEMTTYQESSLEST